MHVFPKAGQRSEKGSDAWHSLRTQSSFQGVLVSFASNSPINAFPISVLVGFLFLFSPFACTSTGTVTAWVTFSELEPWVTHPPLQLPPGHWAKIRGAGCQHSHVAAPGHRLPSVENKTLELCCLQSEKLSRSFVEEQTPLFVAYFEDEHKAHRRSAKLNQLVP